MEEHRGNAKRHALMNIARQEAQVTDASSPRPVTEQSMFGRLFPATLQYWALVIPLFMAGVLICKAFAVPAPIYASDEYAYWRNAVMLGDRAALYAADHRMQRIDNKAYCGLLYACNRLAPGSLIVPALMNTAAWCATIGVVFLTASLLVPMRKAAAAAAIAAVMPSGLMAGTLMADVMFGFVFWLIIYSLVLCARDERAWIFVPIVSSLLALQLAIKPHALATIAAFIAFVATRSPIGSLVNVRALAKTSAIPLALGCLSFGAIHVGVESLESADGSNETGGFGVTYNGFLKRALSVRFIQEQASEVLWDAMPHVIVLLLFFSLPLTFLAVEEWPWRRRGESDVSQQSTRQRAFCRFVGLCVLFTIAMTVLFSTIVGSGNDCERHRLHERYYWFLLPALIITGFIAEERVSREGFVSRVAGVSMLVCWVVYRVVTQCGVRLYPWDAPDFYGLYNPLNRYWGQPSVLPWSLHIVLGAVFVTGLVSVFRPSLTWPFGLATLSLSFFLGWLGVLAWQIGASHEHSSRLAETRAVAMLVGDVQVQAIGSSPYGSFTANLFAFSGNPTVRISGDSTVESKDIASTAGAVFVEGMREFHHPYAWRIGCRSGTMYALRDNSKYCVARAIPAELPAGKEFTCRFSETDKNVCLFGFNQSEAWGAWTARTGAELLLPIAVRGQVRVTWGDGFRSSAWAALSHYDSAKLL